MSVISLICHVVSSVVSVISSDLSCRELCCVCDKLDLSCLRELCCVCDKLDLSCLHELCVSVMLIICILYI